MTTLRSSGQVALLATLRQARLDAGLTARQLSTRLKRYHSYASKIEKGELGIDPVGCAEWARACGIAPRVFFNRFVDALERKV